MSRLITLIVSISTILFAYPALAWEVNENSFRCIKEMRLVDNFFVDNLAGNLDGTLAMALAGFWRVSRRFRGPAHSWRSYGETRERV